MRVCFITTFTVVVILLLVAAGPAIAISPVNIAVSDVETTTTVLVVKADVASDVTVEYGTSPGSYSTTKNSNGLLRHEVTLDGLSPSTTIYYRVTITNSSDPGDTTTQAEQSFSTAASLGDAISFAVTGDNRPNEDTTVQPTIWSTVVSQMISDDVDLVLSVGDLIWGTAGDSLTRNVAKYDGYFATTIGLTVAAPLYIAVGNHELVNSPNNHAGYEQEFTFPTNNGADAGTYSEDYYSFDYGDTHFIALSTEIPGQEGIVYGNQLDWLEADLAANTSVWTVVFMHRPLFSGQHPFEPWVNIFDTVGQQNKDDLHSLFQIYDVEIVFEGHEHHYVHHVEDGIHYVITGGGGAPLSIPLMLSSGDIYGASAYEHVKVDQTTARMNVTAIDSNGQTLETFSIWSLDLDIAASSVRWDSYIDYVFRRLTVDYQLTNNDTTDLSNVEVTQLEASAGAIPVTSTPIEVADIAAGGDATVSVLYAVPTGVYAFNTRTYVNCEDASGNTYEFPGPSS